MDRETIEKVAMLARLRLSDDEVAALQKDIGNIIEYVDQLSALNTEEIEPLAHPGDIVNSLRQDEVTQGIPREQLLQNSPKTDGQFYLVPAVLGETGKSEGP